MDTLGTTTDQSASLGIKLGLVAAILFIVAAALFWHHVYRDPVTIPGSQPDPDRLLVVRLDGPSRPDPVHGQESRDDRRNVPPPSPRPQPPSSLTPLPPPPAPEPRRYEVRKGDCLSTISGEIYGTARRWREIADENDMAPPYELREGMILDLPR